MHSQIHGADQHILAIGLIVAALCVFFASCIRFFFHDIAWKSAKTRNERMGLESKRSARWENNNAAIGCIGMLGSLLLAGVGIALIGNTSTPSPETMQGIVNGTRMYPYSLQNNELNIEKDRLKRGASKMPLQSRSNNKWKADDTPYVKIRHEIDQALLDGTNPDSVLQKVLKEEQGHLKNPLSIFRLAYVAHQAAHYVYYHLSAGQKANVQNGDRKQFLSRQSEELTARLSPANGALFGNPDPHSYEYARLKFLYWKIGDEATGGAYSDIAEAKLLLKKNSNDWEVKQALSMMLAARSEKSYTDQALQYATEVVHANPSDPTAWETLGTVNGYFASVVSEEIYRTKYGPASLAAYQKCLELAPADYGTRSTIEIRMKHLNSVLSAK